MAVSARVSGEADVDGREDGEDVRLEEADEDFEDGEEQQHGERQTDIGLSSHCCVWAKSMASVSNANVTSNMCPASMLAKSRTARLNGRRTIGEELDEADERTHRHRYVARPQHAGEVAEPVVLEADDVVRQPHQDGEEQRQVPSGPSRHCGIGMIPGKLHRYTKMKMTAGTGSTRVCPRPSSA